MAKRFDRTLLLLLALMVAVGALSGCGAKPATPAVVAAPAVAAAPTPAPAPVVDKAAILKDGMMDTGKNYFNTLPPDSNNIKAPDVQKMIDAKQPFFGVDIRSAADFAKGHLPGFVNIPFAQIGQNWDKIPKDKMVIFQCYTGQTASQTTAVFRMNGYNAKNLHFGFQGVSDNKLAVVQ